MDSAYLSKLTDEEIKIILDLTPAKFFQDFFKNRIREFHKFCPGYRPEKISSEKIESIMLTNRNNPALADYFSLCVKVLLDTVTKSISVHMEAGENIHTAMLRALPESDFREHIDLYLKLSEAAYTSEYSQLLQSAAKELETVRGVLAVEQVSISQKITTEETEALCKKLAEAKDELEKYRLETAEQARAYAELRDELEAAQDSLRKKEQELAGLQILIDHADFPEDISENADYPYTSLCQVGGFNGSSVELRRLADVVDGVIQVQKREDFPNRNTLFTKDTSKAENYVGIWNWRTEPNYNSGKLDYIVSKFQLSQIPIQIIEMPNCDCVEELKDNLIQGIDLLLKGERCLFAFADNGRYTGLLCSRKDLVIQSGKVKLKSDIKDLPLYEFSEQEIVKTWGMSFFCRVNLGMPKAMLQVIDPLDIVKKLVMKRAPWTVLKTWFTKKDAQKFWEFLKKLPVDDFYQEISVACACSINEAKEYADCLIQRAGTYLREEDVETEVLETALTHSPILLEKCRLLNEEKWRNEHTEEIEQAQAELAQITKETQRQKKLNVQLSEQQEQLEERRKQLTADVSQKERLAEDVEGKIAQRIDAARKNAADFLCEMAFVHPGATGQAGANVSAKASLFQPGQTLDENDLEHHQRWDELLCTIRDELEEAGVSKRHSPEFAAFLYAAYTIHVPLLLAGPNGLDIADALSAALFGRTASVLRCDGEYDADVVEECRNEEGQIVAMVNPFNPSWLSHISELAAMKDQFLIAVHPFAEDLMIEPRGLYNYILPVLTELLVDHGANRSFVGGCFDEDFQDYVSTESRKNVPLSKQLRMSPLLQNRLMQILADMKVLSQSSTDEEFLFGAVPYAYVTGKSEMLREEVQNEASLSKDVKTLLHTFLGDSE